MQGRKIFYKLEIDTYGFRYFINVNDVLIQDDPDGMPLNVEIPVNELLRSGENLISFELFPWSEKLNLLQEAQREAKIRITLKMYENIAGKDFEFILSSLIYKLPSDDSSLGTETSTESGEYLYDSSLNLNERQTFIVSKVRRIEDLNYSGAIRFEQSITMETPFALWKFFSSDVISDPETLLEEEIFEVLSKGPFQIIEHIHDRLLAEDLDSILPLFKERNDEMDAAMYLEPGSYENKLRSALQKQFDDQKVLFDLDFDYAYPNVSRDGKLLWLGSRPLIYFRDSDETIFTKFQIMFRKDGDNWIISR